MDLNTTSIQGLLDKVDKVDDLEDRIETLESKVGDIEQTEETREEPMDEHDIREAIRDEINDKIAELEDLSESVDSKLKDLSAFDGLNAVTDEKLTKAIQYEHGLIIEYINTVAQQLRGEISKLMAPPPQPEGIQPVDITRDDPFPYDQYNDLSLHARVAINTLVNHMYHIAKLPTKG